MTTVAKPQLTIRRMRREEMAALAESVPELSEAQLVNRFREQDQGFRELYVATLEGRPVGTVSLRTEYTARAMHLFALEVVDDLRNHGIGTQLVEFVCQEARKRGCTRVYLEVRVDNPARRLYHRLGFRRVGKPFVNGWYRFNADGSQDRVEELSLRMVKRLRAG